jgi:hypothetical protein
VPRKRDENVFIFFCVFIFVHVSDECRKQSSILFGSRSSVVFNIIVFNFFLFIFGALASATLFDDFVLFCKSLLHVSFMNLRTQNIIEGGKKIGETFLCMSDVLGECGSDVVECTVMCL